MSSLALPALDSTWGAFFIGLVVATALWGAASVQAYYYYNTYSDDVYALKLLVAIVWALDTIHLILELMLLYSTLITHYGDPLYLIIVSSVSRKAEMFVLLSGFVVLLVQAFYVYRVWQLSRRNLYILVFLVLLLCAEFVTNTLYYAKMRSMKLLGEWLSMTWLSILVNALDAFTSLVLALLVIFFLQKSRTGFKRTESLINRLITWSIGTGLMTSICAILTVIFVSAMPSISIFIALYGLISKLYTNSLLATLNARNQTNKSSEDTDSSASFSHIVNAISQSRVNTMAPAKVFVQREFSFRVDTELAQQGDEQI